MRFVSFDHASGCRAGVLTSDRSGIVDLIETAALRQRPPSHYLNSVQAIIEAGAEALDNVEQLWSAPNRVVVPVAGTRLRAPIPRPVQVRDFLCFEKHLLQGFERARSLRASLSDDPDGAIEEMDRKGILRVPDEWYRAPLYYRVNPANVCGPDTEISWPYYSDVMDFEFEMACVIGRGGKDIARDEAGGHIFGFTVFNDLSARDEQVRVMPGQLGPGKGKDFDHSKPMGPCLVTIDEIGDPYALRMTARLNGEPFVEASTAEMNWRFEDCIAYVSRAESIEPGEIFGSGTVGGGSALEMGRTVSPGDVVELEIEKIGTLTTRFASRKQPVPTAARPIAPINTQRVAE